jgi:hypothetical protein
MTYPGRAVILCPSTERKDGYPFAKSAADVFVWSAEEDRDSKRIAMRRLETEGSADVYEGGMDGRKAGRCPISTSRGGSLVRRVCFRVLTRRLRLCCHVAKARRSVGMPRSMERRVKSVPSDQEVSMETVLRFEVGSVVAGEGNNNSA